LEGCQQARELFPLPEQSISDQAAGALFVVGCRRGWGTVGSCPMVTVYNFTIYDVKTDQDVRQNGKRTAESIERLGHDAKIVEGTAQEVPEDDVDRQGRYIPI
jgi:hypothetical protein